ncbi:hypothetical protein JCM10207_006829 [Rhodosporidiobolus poonsookiae]
MSPRTYLITGASRSLGLGYARALLASSPEVKVVAAARNPDKADQLKALAAEKANDGRVYLLKLDVENAEAVKAAAKELEGSGFLPEGRLDTLINNAGVNEALSASASTLTPDNVLANLNTNLFGVINVTTAFLPLLRKEGGLKQVIGISSMCGSLSGEFGKTPAIPAYCISKVAVNMYLRKLSRELDSEGFTVLMLHPGYVKTDMNKGEGEITTEEATTTAVNKVFLALKQEDNGKFLRWNGETEPW